eukprot:gene8716-biopygen21170
MGDGLMGIQPLGVAQGPPPHPRPGHTVAAVERASGQAPPMQDNVGLASPAGPAGMGGCLPPIKVMYVWEKPGNRWFGSPYSTLREGVPKSSSLIGHLRPAPGPGPRGPTPEHGAKIPKIPGLFSHFPKISHFPKNPGAFDDVISNLPAPSAPFRIFGPPLGCSVVVLWCCGVSLCWVGWVGQGRTE